MITRTHFEILYFISLLIFLSIFSIRSMKFLSLITGFFPLVLSDFASYVLELCYFMHTHLGYLCFSMI